MGWLIQRGYLGKKMVFREQSVIDAMVTAGTARKIYANWYTTVYTDPGPVPPRNIIPPLISGTAQVGQTLTAGAGVWDPTPDSYVFEWYSGPDALSHDSDQYIPVVGDIGKQITAEVVATNANGDSEAVRGNSTAPVIAAAEDEVFEFDDDEEIELEDKAAPKYKTKVVTADVDNSAKETDARTPAKSPAKPATASPDDKATPTPAPTPKAPKAPETDAKTTPKK